MSRKSTHHHRCPITLSLLLIDDAIDFAKMYSAANPNAALFVLLPVAYGTVESKTVLKNRRVLEDKLYAPFASTVLLYGISTGVSGLRTFQL